MYISTQRKIMKEKIPIKKPITIGKDKLDKKGVRKIVMFSVENSNKFFCALIKENN